MKGDWLTTEEAARVYGCHRTHWLRIAKRYAAVPREETFEGARDGVWGRGRRYHWQAESVLRIRAEHALTKMRVVRESKQRLVRLRHNRGAQLKARETRLENYRQKVLARIKERECATRN